MRREGPDPRSGALARVAASAMWVLWPALLMPLQLAVTTSRLRRRQGLAARWLALAWARAWWPGAPRARMGRGLMGPVGGQALLVMVAWCSLSPVGAGAGVIVARAYGPATVVGLLAPGPRILVGVRRWR